MLQSSIFAQSPSFNSYSSNNFAEIAAKVCEEFIDEREELGLEPALHSLPLPVPETLIIKEEEEESEEQISSDNDLTHLTHQQQEEEQPEQAEEVEVEVEEEVVEESGNNEESESDGDDDDDDFEFTFVCRDPDGSPLSADELFANGQIRPVFPVFNRDLLFAGGQDDDSINSEPVKSSTLRVPLKNLFLGDRDSTDPPSSSSSEADELENLPAGTYCVWTPKGKGSSSSSSQASPETCKKSNSTGSGSSSSRRFRFRDFLFRSNSDGKDTFVFLTPSGSGKMKKKDEKAVEKMVKSEVSEEKKHSGEAKVAGKGKSKGAAAEVSPHEIHYVRNRALKQNDRRRSYLPYRQDLVGFFANVNGLSRNLHPF